MGIWRSRIRHDASKIFQEAGIAVTANGKSPKLRLDKSVIPLKYRLFLTPFLKLDNFSFLGHIDIDVVAKWGNISSITLHSTDLNIFENTMAVQDSKKRRYDIYGLGYEDAAQFLTVYLSKELPVDKPITISIDFTGALKEDLMGLYLSKYTNEETNTTEFLATTQFEALGARKALPCFDEPAFKAVFQVNLGRLKNMTSISNMPKETEGLAMPDSNDYVWDVYRESPRMSTYLLAFIVSRFTFRESPKLSNNVQFRIWSRKSVSDQTVYASEIGPKVLQYYESRFQMKFPLPKQDMAAIPDFLMGAMENWGLITYREVLLLFNAAKSSALDRETVEIVVAHELSHQWFGNLVTMEWWTE